MRTEGIFLCPLSRKRSYSSQRAADKSVMGTFNPKGKLRSYLCECGEWHLTSMTVAQYQNSIRNPKVVDSVDDLELRSKLKMHPGVTVVPTKNHHVQSILVNGDKLGEVKDGVVIGRRILKMLGEM